MNQILDNDILTSKGLIELLEMYITTKRSGQRIDTNLYINRLKTLGKSEAQIHDILIEFDDESDKELLASIGVKRAKRLMVFGLILGVTGIIFGITMALGVFHSLTVSIVPFGLVASSFITVGKAYSEIGLVKKRRKRRALKWENW